MSNFIFHIFSLFFFLLCFVLNDGRNQGPCSTLCDEGSRGVARQTNLCPCAWPLDCSGHGSRPESVVRGLWETRRTHLTHQAPRTSHIAHLNPGQPTTAAWGPGGSQTGEADSSHFLEVGVCLWWPRRGEASTWVAWRFHFFFCFFFFLVNIYFRGPHGGHGGWAHTSLPASRHRKWPRELAADQRHL